MWKITLSSNILSYKGPEAATQRCIYEKVFWKYATNLQENTHAEVRFNKLQSNFIEITFRDGCFPANLLHIFKTLFLRKPLGGCFWRTLLCEASIIEDLLSDGFKFMLTARFQSDSAERRFYQYRQMRKCYQKTFVLLTLLAILLKSWSKNSKTVVKIIVSMSQKEHQKLMSILIFCREVDLLYH